MVVLEKYGKVAGSLLAHSFQNRNNDSSFYYGHDQESPRKYLRFWGREPRWLPIPENSDAQRTIRELNRIIQLQPKD